MITSPAPQRLPANVTAKAVTMDYSHARFARFPEAGSLGGFTRPGAPAAAVGARPADHDVVMALEERMWRDRRELWAPGTPYRTSAAGRLRGRVRDFISRMQLGPVADDAAGRDPDMRF